MIKSEAGSPECGPRRRNSKLENQKLPLETCNPAEAPLSFDSWFSSFDSRASESGLRTLIIGYGNPLRSDDGFGWHASRQLALALAGQDAEVITCHQLTPELAEPLSQCRRAVFIDADVEGKPGDIECHAVHPQAPASATFTHSCTPSGLLASAEGLYGHRPQAVVITVSAQSFAFGETLSSVVSAALLEVVNRVCHWVRNGCAHPVTGGAISSMHKSSLAKI